MHVARAPSFGAVGGEASPALAPLVQRATRQRSGANRCKSGRGPDMSVDSSAATRVC